MCVREVGGGAGNEQDRQIKPIISKSRTIVLYCIK